jgi:hypothetical protein
MASHLLFLEGENTGLGIKTKQTLNSTGAVDITLAGLSQVLSGDLLFIVGHGSATKQTLTGHSPSGLAKLLTDSGLRWPVDIFLYSCSTGFGGAPYALELKIQLVQNKVLCSVAAPTGPINATFKVRTNAKSEFYGTGHLPTDPKPSWVK